jgi:hypothetical protein
MHYVTFSDSKSSLEELGSLNNFLPQTPTLDKSPEADNSLLPAILFLSFSSLSDSTARIKWSNRKEYISQSGQLP